MRWEYTNSCGALRGVLRHNTHHTAARRVPQPRMPRLASVRVHGRTSVCLARSGPGVLCR